MWLVILLVLGFVQGDSQEKCLDLESSSRALDLIENFYFSGRDINDFGFYDECLKMPKTNYALMIVDYRKIKLYLGLCVPSSCTIDDILKPTQLLLSNSKASVPKDAINVIFSNKYNDEGFGYTFGLLLIFSLVFVYIVAAGTYYDSKQSDSLFKAFLVHFSLTRNVKLFMDIPNIPENLQFINGIRVIASNLLVFFHVFQMNFYASIINVQDIERLWLDFPHLFLTSMVFFVDVFFFISGFLMTILTLSELMKQRRNFSWKLFVVRRIIRYSPVHFTVLIFFLIVFRHIGSGPQWPMYENIYPKCPDYWWSNFLYLNDLIPYTEKCCIGWSWYIAAELKFFMISPLILLAYIYKKHYAYMLIVLLVFLSYLYIGITSTVNEFTPTYLYGYSNLYQYELIYVKPQGRVSTFLVGIVVGFLYLKNKQIESMKEKSVETIRSQSNLSDKFEEFCIKLVNAKKVRKLGYAFGAILVLWVCFIVRGIDKNGESSWTQTEKSTYLAVHRTVLIIGFSMWFFPMTLGHFQPLQKILSLGIFIRLAKLSYAIYMTHVLCILYSIFTRKQGTFISYFEVFNQGASAIVIANIISFMIVILIEFPVLSIEKAYLRN